MISNQRGFDIALFAVLFALSAAATANECPGFRDPPTDLSAVKTREDGVKYWDSVQTQITDSQAAPLGKCLSNALRGNPKFDRQVEIDQFFKAKNAFDRSLDSAIQTHLASLASQGEASGNKGNPVTGGDSKSMNAPPSIAYDRPVVGSSKPLTSDKPSRSAQANENRCNSVNIVDACQTLNPKGGIAACVHETEIRLGCWKPGTGSTGAVK